MVQGTDEIKLKFKKIAAEVQEINQIKEYEDVGRMVSEGMMYNISVLRACGTYYIMQKWFLKVKNSDINSRNWKFYDCSQGIGIRMYKTNFDDDAVTPIIEEKREEDLTRQACMARIEEINKSNVSFKEKGVET